MFHLSTPANYIPLSYLLPYEGICLIIAEDKLFNNIVGHETHYSIGSITSDVVLIIYKSQTSIGNNEVVVWQNRVYQNSPCLVGLTDMTI